MDAVEAFALRIRVHIAHMHEIAQILTSLDCAAIGFRSKVERCAFSDQIMGLFHSHSSFSRVFIDRERQHHGYIPHGHAAYSAAYITHRQSNVF